MSQRLWHKGSEEGSSIVDGVEVLSTQLQQELWGIQEDVQVPSAMNGPWGLQVTIKETEIDSQDKKTWN